MPSPPVTFPCPQCSRRMGVPAELLGRQVRCPHCKQVVVAPATAGDPPTSVAPPPTPPVPAPAPVPPPAPEPELRPFNLPTRKEGADSILSEPHESDDEVFGSHPGNRLANLPPLDSETLPPTSGKNPFAFTSAPPAAPEPAVPTPAAPAPKKEVADPFADLGGATLVHTLPPPKSAVPKLPVQPPAPVPTPAPLPAPQPAASDPFANFDAPIAVPPAPVKAAPRPAPVEELPLPEDDAAPSPLEEVSRTDHPNETPTRTRKVKPAGGRSMFPLALLGGYAVLATLVAVYGLFFRSGGGDAGHPLSTIPDTFGEFDPVSRKKVGRLTVPADAELPPAQRAKLGDTLAIGQLEVKPVRVEKRRLMIEMEDATGKDKRKDATRAPALVLALDIRNTSPDLPIHPLDPAFTRREGKSDPPLTRLVAGKRAFVGGEIEWPLPRIYKKRIEVQQGNDAAPLKPGESREYVVFTAADPDVVRTAEAEKGPLQWRVQVRRGLIDYKGREVPVTAVVGVDFLAADIRAPG